MLQVIQQINSIGSNGCFQLFLRYSLLL